MQELDRLKTLSVKNFISHIDTGSQMPTVGSELPD